MLIICFCVISYVSLATFTCSRNRCSVSLSRETSDTALSLSGNAHQGHSPAGMNVSLSPMGVEMALFPFPYT